MKDIMLEAWDMILRTIWLIITVSLLIGGLWLCSWADEGARELQDNTVLPSERVKDVNYGPRQ